MGDSDRAPQTFTSSVYVYKLPMDGNANWMTPFLAVALVMVLVMFIIVLFAWMRERGRARDRGHRNHFVSPEPFVAPETLKTDAMLATPPEGADPAAWAPPAERRSVHAALSRLYTTADADPLVTGQLYEFSDGVRDVYSQRTSHGDVQGLTEYSSSGSPGDVGVDVGPNGLYEYGGGSAGYDDGIPEEWRMPSTPVRWYRPEKRDYFGPEGPTVYSEGLYSQSEPDHDPLVD